MGIPKNLWEAGKQENSLQDKKIIEALRERLNNKIQNDPKLARKAALILEQWLNKKPKTKP
jgi:hypothetical protein